MTAKVMLVSMLLASALAGHGCQIRPPAVVPVTITDITFDRLTHNELAPGSDNFPITWADDGHLYTAWGDGGGFGGTNSDGRVSLGFGRIEGGPFDYTGHNVWGGLNPENPATFEGKSYGILYVDGALYAWVGKLKDVTGSPCRLYKSTDHGASWQSTGVEFVPADLGGAFTYGNMLNFGQAYAGARDGFVYTYFGGARTPGTSDSSDEAYLTRVPIASIETQSAYEFFAGFDVNGNPTWSSNIADRQPVYSDPDGVHWTFNVVYIAPLDKYLFVNNSLEKSAGDDSQSDLSFYQADEPWGRWTHVKTFTDFRPPMSSDFDRYTFFYDIPAKWVAELSGDRLDFTMVFTGTGTFDSWNTMRGTFTVEPEVDAGDLSSYDLVDDHQEYAIPAQPKPDYLASYTDPTFGTKVTRITGDPGTAIPNLAGETWGRVSYGNYWKLPVWSTDETLMVLQFVDGVRGSLFLDGETYEVEFARSLPSDDTRWHPAKPAVMLYLKSNGEFGEWDPRTDVETPIHTVVGYSDCTLGPNKGNFSHDGTMAAVYATRDSDGVEVAFAVHLPTGTKFPDIDLTGMAEIVVTISALGNFIVVNAGIPGGDPGEDNVAVYDLQGNEQSGSPWLDHGNPSHFDLGVDVDGNEVAIGVSKADPHSGKAIMRRLSDGAITELSVGGYATQGSTRNHLMGRWAFVSHPDDLVEWPPYKEEVFAVRLDDTRTIARLVHVRNNWVDYDSQAHGAPSPSGTRFLFSSNWDEPSGRPVQSYVVDYRHLAPS